MQTHKRPPKKSCSFFSPAQNNICNTNKETNQHYTRKYFHTLWFYTPWCPVAIYLFVFSLIIHFSTWNKDRRTEGQTDSSVLNFVDCWFNCTYIQVDICTYECVLQNSFVFVKFNEDFFHLSTTFVVCHVVVVVLVLVLVVFGKTFKLRCLLTHTNKYIHSSVNRASVCE